MDATPARPDLNRMLEQKVEAGFPPELALDLVLHELVVRAVDATGATSAALALARGGEMVCRAATGLHAPDLGVPLNTRDGLSGACLRTRQPQLCADAESDPLVDAVIARRLGIRSILIVPVLEGSDLIGVLEVFSSEPSAFSGREQALLETSARDCARVRNVAADLGQRPPTALERVASALQPAQPETPPPTSPALVDVPASPHKTQPLYENWTLILATLSILAAIALSLMVGARLGWLFSSPQLARVTQPASSNAAKPAAPPAPPAARSPSPRPAARSLPAAPSPPTSAADELVVYDHGKVIFRMKPATSTSKRNAAPEAASQSAMIVPSSNVWLAPDQAELRLLNRVEPQYPADALAAHRSGDVVLEVLVAEDGSVASIRTLTGDPLLAGAAADAVRQWRYEPYRQNERPSQFQTDVTLKFSLPN